MDDTNHADLLRQGAAAWNRHRIASGEAPHLVEVDLGAVNLEGADLRNGIFLKCKLQQAKLRGAKLQAAHIVESDLTEASLCDASLEGASCIKSNFLGADLTGADLRSIVFHDACLTGADLRKARFNAACDFSDAELMEAKLAGADLSGASLIFADLRKADLTGANLTGANLGEVIFSAARLSNADLSQANLAGATLIRTHVDGARFTRARIYGISVWDLRGTPADESELVITPADDPAITVSDLEVAQFVYLLLNNAKIRDVIDTVTAKAVLILGRFSAERKLILDKIRELLARADYVPIVFDFDKPAKRDLTETVRTLAHLSRFIIADITDPKSIPQELTTIIPQLPSVPVQPILLEGNAEWAMLRDLKRTGTVLETFVYRDLADVSASLRQKILDPAESWLRQFSASDDPLRALRAKVLEAQQQRLENERLREELKQLRQAAAAKTRS